MANTIAIKRVLHVGCGRYRPDRLHERYRSADWEEVRLDIDPGVKPDIVASLTDMGGVETGTFDAFYSSHNLEHLHFIEVEFALNEFFRVLKPGGEALITLPDLEAVCKEIAAGHSLVEPLYESPAGPTTAMDVIFGHIKRISKKNDFMAHKCGFTREVLTRALRHAGFVETKVWPDKFRNLWATARKRAES